MQYPISEIFIAPFLSDPFHICTELYNKPLQELHFYKAIVCGIPPMKEFYPGFLGFGLWHLIVISAGHWNFLKVFFDGIFFKKIKNTKTLSLITLIVLAGINPPIAKSLCEWFLEVQNRKQGWKLLGAEIVFLSVFITILFYRFALNDLFPSALFSILASWNLSLSLLTTRKTKSIVLKVIQIQVLIFPLVLSFGQSFFLSLFGNLILAPIIGIFLFPSCLLVGLSSYPFDDLNHLLIQGINHFYLLIKPRFNIQHEETMIPMTHYLIFLFVFQLCLIIYDSQIQKQRATC